MLTTPVEMMLFAISGWFNEEQRHKIEFLQEQVRVLQERNGVPERESGPVVRRERLGDLLNHYYREAA